MLGDSTASGGGGDAAAPPNVTAETAVGGGGGGVGSNSESDVERSGGERSFGGKRWPRQETLALLRIRSEMDIAFRDASVKGPLWDEVSRKLAEIGFQRSAKKCKEKFENVYKYHKRTKDGRGGKSDGKTYRFFEQLEALEQQISAPTPISQVVTTTITETTTIPMSMPPVVNTTTIPHVTVSSIPMSHNNIVTTQPIMNMNLTSTVPSTSFQPSTTNPLPSFTNISTDLFSNSMESISYSTSSEDTMDQGSRKRKRDWKDFLERLMKQIIQKQEDMQKRLLEAVEKREQDLIARNEAWRQQELQKINREREILAQERSLAASKDAAIMSFLQNIAQRQNLGEALGNIIAQQLPPPQQPQQQNVAPTPTPVSVPAPAPAPTPTPTPTSVVQVHATLPLQPSPVTKLVSPIVSQQQQQQQQQLVTNREIVQYDNNGGENFPGASSSRWPKVEIEALINLRTSMDNKYQENGPKGALWEEISAGMRNLGYNRNAKRCKEKWENINKYYKKVKESNKKRPEDSKTCPYFHQLDALYKEKGKVESSGGGTSLNQAMAPLMVRPEQQWPPQQEEDRMEENHGEEANDMDGGDKERVEEDGEEHMGESGSGGGGSNFEIVANKPKVGASA